MHQTQHLALQVNMMQQTQHLALQVSMTQQTQHLALQVNMMQQTQHFSNVSLQVKMGREGNINDNDTWKPGDESICI
jgi:extradiol dioxygenase family protein